LNPVILKPFDVTIVSQKNSEPHTNCLIPQSTLRKQNRFLQKRIKEITMSSGGSSRSSPLLPVGPVVSGGGRSSRGAAETPPAEGAPAAGASPEGKQKRNKSVRRNSAENSVHQNLELNLTMIMFY
jgi:hypothetical protein